MRTLCIAINSISHWPYQYWSYLSNLNIFKTQRFRVVYKRISCKMVEILLQCFQTRKSSCQDLRLLVTFSVCIILAGQPSRVARMNYQLVLMHWSKSTSKQKDQLVWLHMITQQFSCLLARDSTSSVTPFHIKRPQETRISIILLWLFRNKLHLYAML